MSAVPYRILVTGWRAWPLTHAHVVYQALSTVVYQLGSGTWNPGRPIVVAQGECPYGGVDLYAKQWATACCFQVEPDPADRGPQGQILGPARNSRMVARGADVCLGFPGPNSRGTWDCIRKAVDADIQTLVYPWSTASSTGWALGAQFANG